jgi:hypothetical protein
LEEINVALNGTNDQQGNRLKQFESDLSAMYAALPKNELGSLGHATVHYALHRLFMERHGWFFRGLEPAGASWSTLVAGGILKDSAPAYIQQLFEEQLGGQGFALRELAVLAATLEHLVNNEAQERLRQAFQQLQFSQVEKLTTEQFDAAMDLFLVAQITKATLKDMSAEDVAELRTKAKEVFPKLPEALKVVHGVVDKHGDGMNFAAASSVVAESGKHLGLWHKGQCQKKKDELIALGDRGVGRVPLSRFYQTALSRSDQGSHQTEHIDYLRDLGALDESVPQKPTVLVSNYVNSRANCFASSAFYSICCPNECESLMRYLEQHIASPVAKPAHIQKLVANLTSSIVKAPRELPVPLFERLEDIATKNGGDVPIHGRLFAQWMHHAYPRECPYPHATGATRPQTADEWMADTGKESTHTRKEIEEFVKKATEIEVTETGEEDSTEPAVLPWTDEEELLVVRPTSWAAEPSAELPKQGPSLRILRCAVFALVLAMMCWLIQEKITGIVGIARTAIDNGLGASKVLYSPDGKSLD